MRSRLLPDISTVRAQAYELLRLDLPAEGPALAAAAPAGLLDAARARWVQVAREVTLAPGCSSELGLLPLHIRLAGQTLGSALTRVQHVSIARGMSV